MAKRPVEGIVRQPEREIAGRLLCMVLGLRYDPNAARFYAEYILREEWDVIGTDKTRRAMRYGLERLVVLAEIVLD